MALEAALRGKKASLTHEEAISCDAQGGVMMKAAPAAPFIVVESQFLFEFLIIPLDSPAQLGGMHQVDQGGRLG